MLQLEHMSSILSLESSEITKEDSDKGSRGDIKVWISLSLSFCISREDVQDFKTYYDRW
jgi:hypothetical protein